jgi:hypothetical protein
MHVILQRVMSSKSRCGLVLLYPYTHEQNGFHTAQAVFQLSAYLNDVRRQKSRLVDVVYEVASRSVGAESAAVKRPTEFCLVARMPFDRPKFARTVSELAPIPVATVAARFRKRPTQLGLVAVCGRKRAGGGAVDRCR